MDVPSLLARLRFSDQQALADLYREYHHPLWRLAVVLVRDRDIAEEIVHDVFLALWRRREALHVTDDVRAYLYASVRNRAMDHLRHEHVINTVPDVLVQEIVVPRSMGQAAPSPDQHAEFREFQEAYRAALRVLRIRDRAMLLLRWEEEMTFEQIAQVLGMSIEGVRKGVLRAQERIQRFLAEYRS